MTRDGEVPPFPLRGRGRSVSDGSSAPPFEDETMSGVFIIICDPEPRLVPKPKRPPFGAGLFEPRNFAEPSPASGHSSLNISEAEEGR